MGVLCLGNVSEYGEPIMKNGEMKNLGNVNRDKYIE